MTSYFPDLNVWLALSVGAHPHSREAWRWLDTVQSGSRIMFARYTQLGLLRLLTNEAVMGEETLTIRRAWSVYDRWIGDSRVVFLPESRSTDSAFRQATNTFASQQASKWIGDCYLIAYAGELKASLITFDRKLAALAAKQKVGSLIPS